MSPLLGSHITFASPDYFLGAAKEALSYREDTFMFSTGAPQNSRRVPLDMLKIQEGLDYLKEQGIPTSCLVVHAPYIINLANRTKPDNLQFAKEFLIEELRRCAALHVPTLVLHPGSHIGLGEEEGTASLIEALDDVLSQDGTNVRIALETMAGKGSEIGVGFPFFASLLTKVKYPERIGVCLDTCHIHDSGMDLSNPEAVLDEFDRVIGLEKLLVVHLNDSKNVCGAMKDRHENLGYGCIGFDTLRRFAFASRLEGKPIILETPWVNEKPPYKKEIELLRSGIFQEGWREAL